MGEPEVEENAEFRREIETGQPNIGDIEAFIEMERAKLEDDPDYDQSFLLEALDEQREIREAIEAKEKRLQKAKHGKSKATAPQRADQNLDL